MNWMEWVEISKSETGLTNQQAKQKHHHVNSQ